MGAYTEIVDFTFTANETSRTFSGLSITKDDFIKIAVTHANGGTSSNSDIRLLANSSINTNYHHQRLIANGTSVSASRSNEARLIRTTGNQTNSGIAYLKLSQNDRLNIFANHNGRSDSSILVNFEYNTSSGATFVNGITSLTFQSENTNGIGTGSRIQIYRLDAEKIADITVTSNTTQVDISNLSIDKDSEYLLVSDVTNGTSTSFNCHLTPNDLTTLSGYHRQRISGIATSATAASTDDARFSRLQASSQSISYTHIKLSNIGAYTHQSYNIRDYGTSDIAIEGNDSVSSVAENITSITKLNIFSPTTNGIGATSRFILYKLYE